MSVGRVRYFPAAGRELEDAFEWYLQRSVQAAEAFLRETDRAIAIIAAEPTIWPLFQAGTRRYLFRSFPYSIIYRQVESYIEIVAVAHHRRKPHYWSSRLRP